MKAYPLLLSLLLLSACAAGTPQLCVDGSHLTAEQQQQTTRLGVVVDSLTVQVDARWRTREIPVCFEARDSDRTLPVTQIERGRAAAVRNCRELVRASVDGSWGKALSDVDVAEDRKFRFVGWGICNSSSRGVRVRTNISRDELLRDTDGRVVAGWSNGLGTQLDGMPNGVNIYTCDAETVVHEFGHALGFGHEHERSDFSVECDVPLADLGAQTPEASLYIGAANHCSIMSYCAGEAGRCERAWDYTRLYRADVVGVQAAYYPESSAFYCANVDSPVWTEALERVGVSEEELRSSRLHQLPVPANLRALLVFP